MKPPVNPPSRGSTAQKLQQQLRELGGKLEKPPASKDGLIKLLKQAANCLSEIDQSPLPFVLESMQPCIIAISKQELLKHQDRDVKVLVATCICEITRITAPQAPYNDDVLRDIFCLIIGTFKGLDDVSSPLFGRRVVILETLARYRSCVVMLDLDCNDLINEMFSTFFAVISDDHPNNVLVAMQTIMILIVEESEDIQENLLNKILSMLGRETIDISKAARKLAMNVVKHCARKLEPCIKQFLISSLSGDSIYLNKAPDYHEVIYDIYQCAPEILAGIVPYITGELLTDKLDDRMKAVQLLGELFALPGICISEPFQPLFAEFLKRLTDRVVEVRVSAIEYLKNCLMSNPCRPEAPQIIKALSDRLLDYDENVRKQVVAAVFDVACHSFNVIPIETIRLVAERLRDKSLSVKRYNMERLADLYRHYCLKSSDNSVSVDELYWIPGKILRCLYDKDFRSEMIELILCGSLFPPEFSTKNKVKHWVTAFSGFEKVEVKALEQVLGQKQRLQQEMQKYITLRQTRQEDTPDLQKRISGCFRIMSRLLSDPAKAEDCFQTLNQLKDVNIWKILTGLLDPGTSFRQAWSSRDDLLRILGEKHPLYDFMGMLSIKCSYLLFNKEYVKDILSEASSHKAVVNAKITQSSMNFLTIIASFCPLLFAGSEEVLVHLLKEDNEIIKEGTAHVLAKVGEIIREQLATTTSSVDLLLERLCLEGSRSQSKYSVQALAAITKDDGLKSLSVLYKRLVDMLDEKTNLPAILQSLGCIAQIAMPVYETREDEIERFIMRKILECSNITNGISVHKTEWNEVTELCLLKIYSIKTLVKSYLPVKGARLRSGITKMVKILKDILSFGDISKDTGSSASDKAHMRLAAAKAVLRLSRQWDHEISANVFYMTLRTSQDVYPQARKEFLSKVHQYIKERFLDAKYACAFLFNINDRHSPECEEDKSNLLEIVQICQQIKVRQLSMQSDGRSHVSYPEYILAYLVHALAHHPSCPDIKSCTDIQAFEPIYWRLHLFLSVLFPGDEVVQCVGGPNRKKDSFAEVVSIFHSIKCSVDVVDETRSKTIHAICDLGLSIAKKMVQDQPKNFDKATISLPLMLYKPAQNIENESSADLGEETWLCGESTLAHFEALNFDNTKTVISESAEEKLVVAESDIDGSEVPLVKMMKILKSRGTSKKKLVKKRNSPSDIENTNSDVDVLGMVREINLDNIKIDHNTEIIKSSEDHEYFEHEQIAIRNSDEKDLVSQKGKRSNTTSTLDVKTPKRKRSTLVQRSGSSTKRHGEIPYSRSVKIDEKHHASMEQKSYMENDKVKSTDSDLLVSCLRTQKSISSIGRKEVDQPHDREAIGYESNKSSLAVDSENKNCSSQSLKVATRKRKVRSIAGLAKCSSRSSKFNSTELVGSRIKVWWPMDKKFYEGLVQSYDPGKKKHTVLYDDGDIEVLKLDKEKWEPIGRAHMPIKPAKLQHASSVKELLPEKKYKRSSKDGSKKSNIPMKKLNSARFRRKTDLKDHVGFNRHRALRSDINADLCDPKSGVDSDMSNSRPHSGSEVDDVSSDIHQAIAVIPVSEVGKEVGTDSGDELKDSEVEPEVSASDCGKENSDDEPLSAWKVRSGKVV